MRPLLSPKQIVEGLLRNVKRKVEGAVKEAKETGIKQARLLSPLPGVAPYATGEYSESWVWKGNRLVNTSEHAKHTDQGDTRYGGKGSARYWRSRGAVPYSNQIAEAVALTLRKALGRKG